MAEMCPHCGGFLIEKYDEDIEKRGKTVKVINYRCCKCGKWTKKELEEE